MAAAHLLGGPVPGSVTRSGMPASPRPVNADHIEFSASATAPFWARQYTRLFLGNCGFAREAIDTAQTIVSELTANAFNATGNHPPVPLSYSQLARAGVIGLSLRHFPRFLLIEVIDASPEPPVMADPDTYSEHGRGLWVVAALSLQWGYFPVRNGKCVYSILDIAG
jgi:anti-sigma regulatory factor (Ser/Thr protein kinase)